MEPMNSRKNKLNSKKKLVFKANTKHTLNMTREFFFLFFIFFYFFKSDMAIQFDVS